MEKASRKKAQKAHGQRMSAPPSFPSQICFASFAPYCGSSFQKYPSCFFFSIEAELS
jgi:hypothetical protein